MTIETPQRGISVAGLATKRRATDFPAKLPGAMALGLRATEQDSAMSAEISPVPAGPLDAEPEDRPLGPALRRGWRCRCPSCGAGPMLRNYLKVRDNCPVCGEALHHQRADDGPAYLTILIVGHILAPAIFVVYSHYRPEPLVLASIFITFTVGLSLFLLPRLKGMMIALQWAKRMHGFGQVPEPEHG
jgi:uncharacterized protein (DUF983 family)